jgi:radical SAM superfamily enzyme YgiQ (UPF0313 family)
VAAAKKKRIAFRIFSGNRLTLPLLLNIWEQNGLDGQFEIALIAAEPGRLTAAQTAELRTCAACVYSFMTPHLPALAREVRALRSAGGPLPLLVAGGPHVRGETELAGACGFDALYGGAGEEAFLRLGHDLLGGGLKVDAGPLVFPAPTKQAAEGARIPGWENYIPVSKYFKTLPPLEITRGCFWKCRYCQTGGTRPRHRGEESIAFYLDELRRRGLPRVGFISPSALEPGASRPKRPGLERIGRLLELCRRSGLRFIEFGIFPSEIRPDTVSEDALRLLRRHVANRRLTFGAQSASSARLAAIGRGHAVADIENAVAAANEAGFAANLDFIIALPGETAAERNELLDFMVALRRKHRVFFQLHHFFPLAGSAFVHRLPSFLSPGERRKFSALKKNGLASDWWREGERSARAYIAWLQRDYPKFFARFE